MKGILLAGGTGSRLDPITRVASKQLQPVYDKPMIYYPLAMLMEAGIREILLVSTPNDLPRFDALLGDGRQWGIELHYAQQPRPEGIAQALLIGAEFIDGDSVALILGDNIFHGDMRIKDLIDSFESGAVVFGYPVKNPERYGVIELDGDRVVSLTEKPEDPQSNLAVPGFYLYDGRAVEFTRGLEPSKRGELEITDLNRIYLDIGELRVVQLGRGIAWLDSGTHASLLEAANFIATIERRQGIKIACLEEIAFKRGYISADDLVGIISETPASEYRNYLETVLAEKGADA
jgi:glucose-1-phosphate thymidylyltransferase